ncbi:MAG: diadenylate cyclase CdaA [Anaeroplasmataceae bacterium]
MLNVVFDFFNNNLWLQILIDVYLVFVVMLLVFRFSLKYKKCMNLLIVNLFCFAIMFLSKQMGLKISYYLFMYISFIIPICIFILLAPEIRKTFNSHNTKTDIKKDILKANTQSNHDAIADAVFNLASHNIGALITIEKSIPLDQFSEKAIQLNSDISKELLINIFTPLTPLHDGGVIIKGNKIICAGAYYVLANKDDLDKTTGSRHRAALGISEVSDSLTIICSEETGHISLAIEGVMIKIKEREKLLEYLALFLK